MALNQFDQNSPGLNGPCRDGFAVTPNDGADLAVAARRLYIGGAGALKIKTIDGNDLVFGAVTAGTVLPWGALRVYATGTTATNIVAGT